MTARTTSALPVLSRVVMRLAVVLLSSLVMCGSPPSAEAPVAPSVGASAAKTPSTDLWARARAGAIPFGPAAETALLYDSTPHAREVMLARLLSLTQAVSLPDDATVRTLEFQAQELLRDEGDAHARAAMLTALARIHAEAGKAEQATEELQLALQADAAGFGTLLLAAQFAVKERRFADAQAAFEKCLTLDSRNDTVLEGYARALLAQRKFDEASRFLSGAVQVSRSPELRVLFADALEGQHKSAEAISMLMGEVRGDAVDARAAKLHFRLALALLDSKQLDEAEKHLRLAQLAESNPRVTVALIEAQLLRNKASQAALMLDRVLGDIPAEPRPLWTAAMVYALADRADDARVFANHFTELALRDPTQAVRLQRLADALRKSKPLK